jgi:hypothetical protein
MSDLKIVPAMTSLDPEKFLMLNLSEVPMEELQFYVNHVRLQWSEFKLIQDEIDRRLADDNA